MLRNFSRVLWRASAVLYLCLLTFGVTALRAQSLDYSGETEEERPMACPTGLAPSFNWNPSGFPRGFEGQTYWFGNPWWMKQDQQGRGYTTADYFASTGFYTTPPDVYDETEVVLWQRAGHRQSCSIRITRRADGTTVERVRYKLEGTYGELRRAQTACSGGGGGGSTGGGTELVPTPSDSNYDPYSNGGEDGDCDGGGGTGGGEVGTGGGGGGPCGGDEKITYDIICIDIWVEGRGWVEYWCGVAAICG